MAEAIARYDAADVIEASSAGLSPMGSIPEQTKQTLTQNGYSAQGLTSDALTREAADAADIIINMTGKPREETFLESGKSRGLDGGGSLRRDCRLPISACSKGSSGAFTNSLWA